MRQERFGVFLSGKIIAPVGTRVNDTILLCHLMRSSLKYARASRCYLARFVYFLFIANSTIPRPFFVPLSIFI